MTTVRAKFHVNSITEDGFGNVVVHAHPVYGDDPENKAFTDSTPAGDLTIHIEASKPAAKFFEQGKEYFLDFTPVPEGE